MISDIDAKRIIADRVKALRGEKSFREIARACSTEDWTCYPGTIQQIETGEHMPGIGLAHRLAQALGVTLNDLLPPELDPPKSGPHKKSAKRLKFHT